MSWSKFDDAAPKNPKAVAAGNEAWGLWSAAIMYCNRHNTDGYVTLAALAVDCLPRPIALAKAQKLADELCAAVARPDGKGLFEPDRNGMYRVHDFLDWNPSKAEVDSKRKADRDRKRGGKDSARKPDGIQEDSSRESARPPDPPRASPVPSRPVPSRPSPSESTRALEQDSWDGSERDTACPLDLEQRAIALKIHEQLAEALKADLTSVVAGMHEFVGYWTIGAGMGQKRRHWMRKLREHVRKNAGKPGGLEAPGAVAHADRAGNVEHESRKVLRSLEIQARDREALEARKRAERVAANGK